MTEPMSSALEAWSLNHWTRPLKTLTSILLMLSLHVLSLSFALTKAAATMVLLSRETHVPRSWGRLPATSQPGNWVLQSNSPRGTGSCQWPREWAWKRTLPSEALRWLQPWTTPWLPPTRDPKIRLQLSCTWIHDIQLHDNFQQYVTSPAFN